MTGVLYPPFLLFLFLDPDKALHGLLFFNIAVGAIGAYLLCRELGMGQLAALCGGLAFGFSNATADVITYTPVVSGPYAWMPAGILCCERILRAPTFGRGVALGVILTLALMPGHPQPLLFTYQLIALYVVFAALVRRVRIGATTLGSLLLGLALPPVLGAVHLLPALEVMRASVRNANLSVTEMAPAPGAYISWKGFQLSFLWRRELFNPVDLVPLMLASVAVCATRFWRHTIFFALIGVVSLDLAAGRDGYLFPLYTALPLGQLFRDPERYLWVTAFCVAMLTAIAVDALTVPASPPRWVTGLAAIVLPAAVLFGLTRWVPNVGAHRPEQVLLAVLFGGLLLAAVPRLRLLTGTVLIVALVLNLLVYRLVPFRHLVPSGFLLYTRAEVFEPLQARVTPQDRIYVLGKNGDFSLQQKTGSLFGLPSLFDYDSLTTRRFAAFYTMLRTGQHMTSLADLYYPLAGPLPATTRRRLLDLAAVRYLVADEAVDTTGALRGLPLARLDQVDDVRVYENRTALPRARWVPHVNVVPDPAALLWRLAWGSDDLMRVAFVETPPPSGFVGAPGDDPVPAVTFVRNDPEHVVLSVDAPRRGFVVLADQWFPGWRATVAGIPVPILRGDYAFRLVEVPAGPVTVEFRYVPDALRAGALISALTVLAITTLLVRSARRKRLKTGAEHG